MLERIRSITDLPIQGRKVFIRVDFNVPMDGTTITDESRIRATVPTIKHVIENHGRVILASHLGRPKGKPEAAFSLETVGSCLAQMMGVDVVLTDDCIGDGARKVVNDLREGQIALLENLRFHPDEEKDDEKFAEEKLRKE